MEAPRFGRRFGNVRTMGPGRLERERPWLSPANPAEGLWYRALVFKSFRQTEAGVVEVVYIPDDLLPLIPELSAGEVTSRRDAPSLRVGSAAPPHHVRPADASVVEDIFGLVVTARNQPVRLRPDGSLHSKDLQAVNALCVVPVPETSVAADDRLALTVHLALAAELITATEGQLILNAERARAWLQALTAQRLLTLQMAWRDDPHWNDLRRVPSLKPQPTGWRNDPVLARRRVLGFLADCRPGNWYKLNEFANAVRTSYPDFQRPDGDYTSWYIHDLGGHPLMGFEYWDQVEGALLRYLISGPLHWLGVTDLGWEIDPHQPTTFCLAATGLSLLDLAPPPRREIVPDRHIAQRAMVVRDDFTIRVALDASLYKRFQLARFTDFLERGAHHVGYRMSPLSLARARRQGITPVQISTFLQRVSADRVPAKVLEAVQGWYKRSGSVRLDQGVVLRVDRPETLRALYQRPVIASLLGEVLGPQAVLIPRGNVRLVRKWLLEQGYLEGSEEK